MSMIVYLCYSLESFSRITNCLTKDGMLSSASLTHSIFFWDVEDFRTKKVYQNTVQTTQFMMRNNFTQFVCLQLSVFTYICQCYVTCFPWRIWNLVLACLKVTFGHSVVCESRQFIFVNRCPSPLGVRAAGCEGPWLSSWAAGATQGMLGAGGPKHWYSSKNLSEDTSVFPLLAGGPDSHTQGLPASKGHKHRSMWIIWRKRKSSIKLRSTDMGFSMANEDADI